jgi:hypothetical protein
MVVKYTENSELIVHHAYEVSVEDLMRICITKSHSTPILYWSSGILFSYEQIPPIMNNRIEEDFINGIDHWSEVYYSKIADYRPVMEIDEGEFKGAKVRVIDATTFVPHKDFAVWIKSL